MNLLGRILTTVGISGNQDRNKAQVGKVQAVGRSQAVGGGQTTGGGQVAGGAQADRAQANETQADRA